jgi:hypothetical protein
MAVSYIFGFEKAASELLLKRACRVIEVLAATSFYFKML